MAKTLICKLDGHTGALPTPARFSFIYRVSVDTTVQFQVVAGARVNTPNSVLCIELDKYSDGKLKRFGGSTSALGHWIAEVKFERAGNYSFWIEYTDEHGKEAKGEVNWVIVDPLIELGSASYKISSISLQTVLSRCLGPIDRWEKVLSHQKALGYNLFHITPIQELGFSNSLYSINDHNKLNSELFPGSTVSFI